MFLVVRVSTNELFSPQFISFPVGVILKRVPENNLSETSVATEVVLREQLSAIG